jgi:hypothetical protein
LFSWRDKGEAQKMGDHDEELEGNEKLVAMKSAEVFQNENQKFKLASRAAAMQVTNSCLSLIEMNKSGFVNKKESFVGKFEIV